MVFLSSGGRSSNAHSDVFMAVMVGFASRHRGFFLEPLCSTESRGSVRVACKCGNSCKAELRQLRTLRFAKAGPGLSLHVDHMTH